MPHALMRTASTAPPPPPSLFWGVTRRKSWAGLLALTFPGLCLVIRQPWKLLCHCVWYFYGNIEKKNNKKSKLNRFCGLKYAMEIPDIKTAAVGRNGKCSTAVCRIWELFPYQLTSYTHLPIKGTFTHDFMYLLVCRCIDIVYSCLNGFNHFNDETS